MVEGDKVSTGGAGLRSAFRDMNDAAPMKMILLILISLLQAGGILAAAQEPPAKLAREVAEAIERFQKTDSTLAPLFQSAAGYAVFPRVSKGGLVFGGARGDGLVYEAGRVVGTVRLTQATFGAQIGGQVFREVIFFETPGALENFKQSKTEMSAQVSAVAAAEGVARNAKYVDGVLVFTQPLKGLMAEASIGGQKFAFEALR